MSASAGLLKEIFNHLRAFRKVPPVADLASFEQFLAGNAAFVAQKKLFEYVKTRMGISYPKHFENDEFIASLDIAKWNVYAACLSDLAVWMAAQAHREGMDRDEVAAIAATAHGAVIADRFSDPGFTGDAAAFVSAFADRLALTDWRQMSEGEAAFRLSPRELVRWAPIADELKRYDREIVMNSLRFAWLKVREDFRKAYRHEDFLADWRARDAA
jgi:hypothetical protein